MKTIRPILRVMLLLSTVGCSSSSSGGGGGLATLEDFCAKCEVCVKESGFSEGFCTPWLNGNSFNRLGCNAHGDSTQLAKQDVSTGELSGWTCPQFDDNE